MPIYHTLGVIPDKRHIVARQPNGNLYQEELLERKALQACPR